MHVTLVHVQVKPAHIDDFIAATRLNHEASIQEPATVVLTCCNHPKTLVILSFMKPMPLPRQRRPTSKQPTI